jgi:hypothetical protein
MKEALLYRQLLTISLVKKICNREIVCCLLFPLSYGILCLFYAKHSEYSRAAFGKNGAPKQQKLGIPDKAQTELQSKVWFVL